MSRAFVDPETYLAQCTGTGLVSTDPNVARVLELAAQDLESACNRRFLSDTYSAWHSGDLASINGHRLYLCDSDIQGTYATAPVTVVSSVAENGTAVPVIDLSSAVSLPDGECAVLYRDSSSLARGVVSGGLLYLKRWLTGTANIRVTWTGGYTAGQFPADLIELCIELAELWRLAGVRRDVSGIVEAGVNLTFVGKLSIDALRVFRSYKLPRVPRTREG